MRPSGIKLEATSLLPYSAYPTHVESEASRHYLYVCLHMQYTCEIRSLIRLPEVQVLKRLLYTARGLTLMLNSDAPEPDEDHERAAREAASHDVAL